MGKTSRLGSDPNYVRPELTMQDLMSEEEIRADLQGYLQVDDIGTVSPGTHVRYFRLFDGVHKYRKGGLLHITAQSDTYVVLKNGANTWSVPVANTIFFRRMSHKEEIDALVEEHNEELDVMRERIEKLEKRLAKYRKKLILLRKSN